MLAKLGLASLLVVMALPQAAWGKPGCELKEADKGKETVTQVLHPSGPSTRREWRGEPTVQPYRIEYDRIRSGRVLVGKAKLIQGKNGVWYVVTSNKKRLKLLGKSESKTTTLKQFTEKKQVWRICVTGQEVPQIQPGVANESEPALDLVLVRR